MVASVLKFILSIFFLDYISSSSVLSVNESRVVPFTGGYQYYENIGYYKVYSLQSTWGYAWKQCREDGAHLVVIDSDEELNVISDMVELSDAYAYIGVHDFFFEGSFFTITGKPVVPSSYNKWRNYLPDRDQSGNCALLAKDGKMLVEDCGEQHNFICEFELN